MTEAFQTFINEHHTYFPNVPLCSKAKCKNYATNRCYKCNNVCCDSHQSGDNDFCKDCII